MSRTAPRTQATVKLLNLIDTECGASLRAESAAVAVSIARELSEGMTRAERIATHTSSTDVAAPRDGPPTVILFRYPRCPPIRAGHNSGKRPGITGYAARRHARPAATTGDAGTANRADLLTPAHHLHEAQPGPSGSFLTHSPVRSGGLLLRRGW